MRNVHYVQSHATESVMAAQEKEARAWHCSRKQVGGAFSIVNSDLRFLNEEKSPIR